MTTKKKSAKQTSQAEGESVAAKSRINPEVQNYVFETAENREEVNKFWPGGLPDLRPSTIFGYLDIDAPRITPPEYPLELLVKVATQMFVHDRQSGIEEAISEARTLILRCGFQHQDDNQHREYDRMFEEIMRTETALPLEPKEGSNYPTVPFAEAVCFITGKDREDRALPEFRTFIKARRPDITDTHVDEFFARRRPHGFQCKTAVILREYYVHMKQHGLLPRKPRGPKKKKTFGGAKRS